MKRFPVFFTVSRGELGEHATLVRSYSVLVGKLVVHEYNSSSLHRFLVP